MPTSSILKKMILKIKIFDEHLVSFKFKYDFNAFCYSKFTYLLLEINNGGGVFRTSGSCQVCQHESAVYDLIKSEEWEKEIISSTENAPDINEKHATANIKNIATFQRERLKGKLVTMLFIF